MSFVLEIAVDAHAECSRRQSPAPFGPLTVTWTRAKPTPRSSAYPEPDKGVTVGKGLLGCARRGLQACASGRWASRVTGWRHAGWS